jgi:hypothetical protein
MSGTTLKELEERKLLRQRLDSLSYLLNNHPGQVVPWIGAGLSVSYGFPTWRAFLEQVVTRYDEDPDGEIVKQLLDLGFFDLAAEFLWQRNEDVFRTQMHACFMRDIDDAAASHPLAFLGARKIVTTNFDQVLEKMLPWFDPITPEKHREPAFDDRLALLKIHGSITEQESWVITRTQYVQRYSDAFQQEIDSIFRSSTVLFIGCSLLQDPYLSALNAVPRAQRREHFAILSVADNADANRRGKELTDKYGISLIPYICEDHDHSIVDHILHRVRPTLTQSIDHAVRMSSSQPLGMCYRWVRPWINGSGQLDARAKRQLARAVVKIVSMSKDRGPVSNGLLRSLPDRAYRLAPEDSKVREYARASGVPIDESKVDREYSPTSNSHRYSEVAQEAEIRQWYVESQHGNAFGMQDLEQRIESRYGERFGRDRLTFMKVRRAMLEGNYDLVQHQLVKELGPPVSCYCYALLGIAGRNWSMVFDQLAKVNKVWRAASDRSSHGLTFSTLTRSIALVGSSRSDEAFHLLNPLWDTVSTLSISARRFFARRRDTANTLKNDHKKRYYPTELSYDYRRYGSEENAVLVHWWTWFCALLADNRSHEALEGDVGPKVESLSASDRLFQWLGLIMKQVGPDAPHQKAELDEQFHALKLETGMKGKGMLNQVELIYAAIETQQPTVLDGRNYSSYLRAECPIPTIQGTSE